MSNSRKKICENCSHWSPPNWRRQYGVCCLDPLDHGTTPPDETCPHWKERPREGKGV